MDYEQKVRDAGLKLTKARIKLLEALTSNHHSTVSHLKKMMGDVNVASIYNNLFEFKQIGIVSEVLAGGVSKWELVRHDDHSDDFHIHYVKADGTFEDVNNGEILNYVRSKLKNKYKINSIKIEIT